MNKLSREVIAYRSIHGVVTVIIARLCGNQGPCRDAARSAKSGRLVRAFFTLNATSHDPFVAIPAATLHGHYSVRREMGRILCVAEKPSIAKAVANHLAGQNARAVCVVLALAPCVELDI